MNSTKKSNISPCGLEGMSSHLKDQTKSDKQKRTLLCECGSCGHEESSKLIRQLIAFTNQHLTWAVLEEQMSSTITVSNSYN